jgi:hypothetical protein
MASFPSLLSMQNNQNLLPNFIKTPTKLYSQVHIIETSTYPSTFTFIPF